MLDQNIETTVQEIYDQAANQGSIDSQQADLEDLAEEAGTTLEALQAAREARQVEAATRTGDLVSKAVADGTIAPPNSESDNWRINEEGHTDEDSQE